MKTQSFEKCMDSVKKRKEEERVMLALKMEAVCPSTWRFYPQDQHQHLHCHEKRKSQIVSKKEFNCAQMLRDILTKL
jgi:hypothetical protein